MTKQNSQWIWNANTGEIYNELKQILVRAPVLRYFDVNKPVVLSADVSQFGLRVTLLQDKLPVAYASKAMTETESRYAQVEKEALSIVYAYRKFH